MVSFKEVMEQNVSRSDTNGRLEIEYIHILHLEADPNNFYSMDKIEELAANIELIGLQQPLRVRPHELEGGYIVVSGHRRLAALRLLYDGDQGTESQWSHVPCIVDQPTQSEALRELRLIYNNSDTRQLTSADQSRQAQRVEMLLYQLKEEGVEFPGRMRDHVAEACKMSAAKLARLKVIREKLVEVLRPAWEGDQLSESTAYELAKLPPEHQRTIALSWMDQKKPFGQLYQSTAAIYGQRLAEIDKCQCDLGGGCDNRQSKQQKALLLSSWEEFHCGGCCGDCPELVKCKHACPKLADRVAEQKRRAKEARAEAKAKVEREDAPYIDRNRDMWERFGRAVERTDRLAIQVLHTLGRGYAFQDEQKAEDLAFGSGKYERAMELPYCSASAAWTLDNLVQAARELGCSTDYLLGLTDQLDAAQAQQSAKDAAFVQREDWHWWPEGPQESGLCLTITGPLAGGGRLYWWDGDAGEWQHPVMEGWTLHPKISAWVAVTLPESLEWTRLPMEGEQDEATDDR